MIYVPVSVGELLDKISILEIKAAKIEDEAKLANVRRELDELVAVAEAVRMPDLEAELSEVNLALWDVEDALRVAEREQNFGGEFVAMARSVYRLNDNRARIKREINRLSGSQLIEEKSYGH